MRIRSRIDDPEGRSRSGSLDRSPAFCRAATAKSIKIVFICVIGMKKSFRPKRSNGIDSRCSPSGQETRCSRRKGHHRKCGGESQRVSRAYLIEEVAEQAR